METPVETHEEMRPVLLVGRPTDLEEWREKRSSSEIEAWTQYNGLIALLAGLWLEEGWDHPNVDVVWEKDQLYLVPREWTVDKRGRALRKGEDGVRLAREQGSINTRFEWNEDPEAPLRVAVRSVAKVLADSRETVRRARDILEDLAR